MNLLTFLLLPIGIAAAFWGYKLRTLFRFLPGLLAGLLIGGATGYLLSFHIGGAVAGMFFCGLICALLSSAKEKLGVFLEFFAYGYAPIVILSVPLITNSLAPADGSASSLVMTQITILIMGAVVGALLGGLAARFAARVWIIISTSLLGGVLSGIAVGGASVGVGLVTGLLVFFAGMIVQLTITAKKVPADAMVPPAVTAPAAEAVPAATGKAAPEQPILPPPSIQAPVQEETAPIDEAKFCPNCGKPLTPGTKFCPECGTNLSTV